MVLQTGTRRFWTVTGLLLLLGLAAAIPWLTFARGETGGPAAPSNDYVFYIAHSDIVTHSCQVRGICIGKSVYDTAYIQYLMPSAVLPETAGHFTPDQLKVIPQEELALLQLSKNLMLVQSNSSLSRKDNFTAAARMHVAILLVGFLTTIAIAFQNFTTGDSPAKKLLLGSFKASALMLSALSTLLSGLNAFYGPAEAYKEDSRKLTTMNSLQTEIMFMVMTGRNKEGKPLALNDVERLYSTFDTLTNGVDTSGGKDGGHGGKPGGGKG